MKLILILLTIFFLSSCSLKPEISNSANFFLMEIDKNDPAFYQNTQKVLKILHPHGNNYINSKNIIYSKSENSYYPYSLSFWESYLSSQYEILLNNKIQYSGLFAGVINNSSKAKANFLLESRIDSFYHKIRNDNSYIEMDINLFLIDADKKTIISSQRFHYLKQTQTIDAKGAVLAFNQGFNEFTNDCIIWLNKVLNEN